ncbi:MAG: metallophosphatase family protein [Clostridia bacterium]|nr:metallophosphatase family protein [Clostridia bacterium]
MKYAVISDVHGNHPALRAVLEDAGKQGVDTCLFLGDYAYGLPWGNEVTHTIRSLASKAVIRGNGEDYFNGLRDKNHDWGSLEQFKPIAWAHRSLSLENLDYLQTLPASLTLTGSGYTLYLEHAPSVIYRSPQIGLFHCRFFHNDMLKEPFSHEAYLLRAKNAFLSRADALADMRAMPRGVYLFGHNHIQFHMSIEGRYFVNPGSCGEPLDWNPAAAYTVLDCSKDGCAVTERRVDYDRAAAIRGLRETGYAAYAPVWSDVMERALMTGKDYFYPLVLHLRDTAKRLGKTEYPVDNAVWNEAVITWEPNGLY